MRLSDERSVGKSACHPRTTSGAYIMNYAPDDAILRLRFGTGAPEALRPRNTSLIFIRLPDGISFLFSLVVGD